MLPSWGKPGSCRKLLTLLPRRSSRAKYAPMKDHGDAMIRWPRRTKLEVLAVFLTAGLHLVLGRVPSLKGAFIAAALLGWASYIGLRVRRDPSLLEEWGFSRHGLARATLATSVAAAVGFIGMGAIAGAEGALRVHWHMLPLLLLYPLWGLVQQFLVQAIFVRPLCLGPRALVPPVVGTAIAAALFAAVHLPGFRLTIATGLLGLVFTPIYLRWRNLWPLGLFHGWLGVAAYFWLLQRDPWVELLAGLDRASP
jgi:hypothetical protein